MIDAMTPNLHSTYYLKDGVVFLVQNTFFKIPRYMLETSSAVFTELLENVLSNNETQPVRLDNITAVEFEHLLLLLYPLCPPSPTSGVSPNISQWISILHLSAPTMYNMPHLYNLSMQLLNTQVHDPLLKISLGRTYEYVPWVKEGFAILCLRKEPLSIDESVQLSKEDIVKLAAAREKVRDWTFGGQPKGLLDGVIGQKLIKGKDDTALESDLSASVDILLKSRTFQRILNHAFHFQQDLVESREGETISISESSSSTIRVSRHESNTSRWFPPALSLPMSLPQFSLAPCLFWLVNSPSDVSRTRKKLRDSGLSADDSGASIMTIDEFIEKHPHNIKEYGKEVWRKMQQGAANMTSNLNRKAGVGIKTVVAVAVVAAAGMVATVGSTEL